MNNYLVYNLLKESSKKWANNYALHSVTGSITYGELFDKVEKLRKELIIVGIKPGMGVGVMARNSSHFIISVYAVLGCGAAVMPVSHQLKESELSEILEVAKLNAMIDDQSGISPLSVNHSFYSVDNVKMRFGYTNISQDHIFASHVDAPAFIRFTSGTTGVSKGVVISNDSVLERTAAANKSLELNENSNVVWVLPMAYHFVVSIALYLRVGSAITIVHDFMARSIIEMTNRFQGTMLYASPMQIRMLSADRGTENMNTLQKIISTSSGISAQVSQAFNKRFNIIVHQAFGIIEVGLPIINTDQNDDSLNAVGYSLPDFDVQVFDSNFNVLPANTVGMLGLRGPGMFDAYLSPPKMREEFLKKGYFFTADYAKISESGLITIEGRKKSMINVSGNKVFAEEVENILEQHPDISRALVSGVPHPLMGQIIQAKVVLNSEVNIDTEEVLTFCRKRLSTFKIPQRIIVVKELKMTNTGKVVRDEY